MNELLSRLTKTFGVAGYEKEVRHLIEGEIRDLVDDITVDPLGNLIALKRGTASKPRKIMIAAHMDEIGMQVTKIEEDGRIKVKMLGFLWPETTYMSRVQFRNGQIGVVAGEVKEGKCEFNKLYVDIGAHTREEAEKVLRIGDVASYMGEYLELQGNRVIAKALDDRIGCYIMIETLKCLRQNANDLYFVFTVQEELGLRGATTAANQIKPDLGLSVDITPAHDYPCDLEGSNALGKGSAIKVSDPSVICDEEVVEALILCAKEHGIPYQLDAMDKGGTDCGAINRSGAGVPVSAVSIATRFGHGPNGMIEMGDVEASIQLLSHFLSK